MNPESVDSVSPVAVVVVEGVLVLVQGKAGMEVDWQLQSICIQCNIMHAHITKCCRCESTIQGTIDCVQNKWKFIVLEH